MAHVAWPRAQPLGQSVLLKFLLETRLESESFEPLINFLVFLVQKLWSKINELIDYLIIQIFFTSLDHNFWTWNLSRSSKVSKDLDCSLVSSKIFSEILPPNGWHPGPGKVGQGGLNVLHIWCHWHKTHIPQAKKFFSSADEKTCHVFWRFDQVRDSYRSRNIPAQSHVRLGGLFFDDPQTCRTPKC